MNEQYLRNVIEAALLAAGRPVPAAELIQLFDENARPTMEQLRAALDALAGEYAGRGIELKETAGGVRIQVRRELASEVSRLWPERPARYSRALLETLALIAYRQPITRGEIEAVRGVAVNPNIVKTLLERNWVRIVGHRDVPGRPELLGTTREFLDYFGLRSLDELPPLSELKAMGDINLQLDLQGEAGARVHAEHPPGDAAGGEGAESAAPAAEVSPQASAGSPTPPAAGEPSDEALLEGRVETVTGQAAVESAVEDDEDGDESEEMSADGADSHELVAAPRDNGD
jgi:segregation and condensation protein B